MEACKNQVKEIINAMLTLADKERILDDGFKVIEKVYQFIKTVKKA
jgi:hypothetical protein